MTAMLSIKNCFASILIFVAGSSLALSSQSADAELPNVVLIISDDHHWSDYSFMGHAVVRTPHLDRLASQSAVFPRGYVPTSLCSPSLASIITGLYPHQHGITGNDPAIPPGLSSRNPRGDARYLQLCNLAIQKYERVPTLPRVLAQKGYVSFQSGKWWGGNFAVGGFTNGMTHGDTARGGRHGDEGLKIGRQGLKPIFEFVESARRQKKPFLVWYAPFLPHTPHNPPEELLARYQNPNRPPALAKYYAMCEWLDQTCGELLQYLDKNELTDNTIVLYVADNGWIQRTPEIDAPAGWNRAFAPRSKQSPYEGGVRTPIMIRWPGRVKPGVREALASSLDFFPTVLSAAGIQSADGLPGVDLTALATGESSEQRKIFGEIFAHDMADLDDPGKSLIYTWCTNGRWKLIATHEGQMGRYASIHPQTRRPLELYDLQADPNEQRELSQDNRQIADQMSEMLAGWRRENGLPDWE